MTLGIIFSLVFYYWIFILIIVLAVFYNILYFKIFIKKTIYEKKDYFLISYFDILKKKMTRLEIEFMSKIDLKNKLIESLNKMGDFSKKENFVMFFNQEDSSEDMGIKEMRNLISEKFTKKEHFDAILDSKHNLVEYLEIKEKIKLKQAISFKGDQKFLEYMFKKY